MNRTLAGMAAVGLLWAAQAAAQGSAKPDLDKGAQIAKQVCAACHAADGNSVAPANPKLAGQIPEYLHKQLVNFKAQGGKKAERIDPIMAGMVAGLSDGDMRNVAAYYAAQKLQPAKATSKVLAAAGQKLWRGGNAASGVPACAGCHGPSGAGIPAQYPKVAGQYAEYVAAQLKLFKEGGRQNDPNGAMRGVAARLTEREIRAVSEYAAGLR